MTSQLSTVHGVFSLFGDNTNNLSTSQSFKREQKGTKGQFILKGKHLYELVVEGTELRESDMVIWVDEPSLDLRQYLD